MNLKKQIIATARAMNALGLNQGASGNVSARRPEGEGMYITPSGVPYDAMRVRDNIKAIMEGAAVGEF